MRVTWSRLAIVALLQVGCNSSPAHGEECADLVRISFHEPIEFEHTVVIDLRADTVTALCYWPPLEDGAARCEESGIRVYSIGETISAVELRDASPEVLWVRMTVDETALFDALLFPRHWEVPSKEDSGKRCRVGAAEL